MSSSTASNMVASLALAALTITASGSPPASPARVAWSLACPDRQGWRRSGPPFDRSQAEAIDADALKVDAAGRAQLIEQQRLELLEHSRLGPLIQPAPAARGR